MPKRLDLSDWIIHFVHQRQSINEPLEFSFQEIDGEYSPHPDGFSFKGKPQYLTHKPYEDSFGLAPDEGPFGVLQKILKDGLIRAGWSYRKGNPTIYGPKAAVCFTEMPLYGLLDYAKRRAGSELVSNYGIAFPRIELFEMGARPVIYGLSTKHEEAKKGDPFYKIGLRTLASDCGIGLKEQYRYVYTNLRKPASINKSATADWTHEREWRWADLNEEFDFPGLPIFAESSRIKFSKIIVLVNTPEEASQILDLLKNLHQSEFIGYFAEYDITAIENTYVLSIEEALSSSISKDSLKLEDLPLRSIDRIQHIAVSAEVARRVTEAFEFASVINFETTESFIKLHRDRGPCGWASVKTFKPNSEITQALYEQGNAYSYGDGSYYITNLKLYPCQSIEAQEAGAKAAAEYLTQQLGQEFYYNSQLD